MKILRSYFIMGQSVTGCDPFDPWPMTHWPISISALEAQFLSFSVLVLVLNPDVLALDLRKMSWYWCRSWSKFLFFYFRLHVLLLMSSRTFKQYLKTYLFSLSFLAHNNTPFYDCVKRPSSSWCRLRRFKIVYFTLHYITLQCYCKTLRVTVPVVVVFVQTLHSLLCL